MELDRVYWRGARISDVSFRNISFNDSRFSRSIFKNVRFDGQNADIPPVARPRTLEMDSTVLQSAVFDNVNLRSSYIAHSLIRNVQVHHSDLDASTLDEVWIDGLDLYGGVSPAHMQIAAVQDLRIRDTRLPSAQIHLRQHDSDVVPPGRLWPHFEGDGYDGVRLEGSWFGRIEFSGLGSNGVVGAPAWLRDLCRARAGDVQRQVICH